MLVVCKPFAELAARLRVGRGGQPIAETALRLLSHAARRFDLGYGCYGGVTVGLSIGFRTISQARMSCRRIVVRRLSHSCRTKTSAASRALSRSRRQRGPKIRISLSEMVGLFQRRWSQVSNVCAGRSFCAWESSAVFTCGGANLSKRFPMAAIVPFICCYYR